MLLKGAIAADGMVGLKLNVEKKNLKKVLTLLSSLKDPTISHLRQKNWLAAEVIIPEAKVRAIVPKLKMAGAQGIIEYPLNKIIY